jgi:acyl dehydratase
MSDEVMRDWAAGPPLELQVRIDRKDVIRFAVATGATEGIHTDPQVARDRGFADVVAPPLFYISLRTGVFNLVPQHELHEEGTPLRDLPPIDFTQAMAGETTAELCKPFVAGDLVTCRRRVKSTSEKVGRSGKLTFVNFEYRYADPDDDPFVVEHFTRIFR